MVDIAIAGCLNRDIMLTQRDFDRIEKLIDAKLEEKLTDKLKYLPTKDEFYKKMDEVMGELKAIRGEHSISAYQVADHEERLEALEKKIKLIAN